MRAFEVILLVIVSIIPFAKRPITRLIHANYLLLIFVGLSVAHLALEGWRWQMVPTYLLMLILGWRLKAIEGVDIAKLSFIRVAGFFCISILALVGWVLPMTLPVFSLPEPRGAYSVGTQLIHIRTDWEETITKDPSDKRELLYKIWYPSDIDVSRMTGEKYVDEASRAGFATKYGLPPAGLNYLDLVDTYAYQGLAVSEGQFPVLIFSHGYGSKATGYYALLTELASQGYIVVNMNHTYESLGVTFPDGRVKYFDYDFQKEISFESMQAIQPLIEAFKNNLEYKERHPIVRKAVKNYYESKTEDRWAEDMMFTIDLLDNWNTEGWLKDKLELDKLGVFGHSNGGGSAGKVAIKDERVKAAANLDGIQWGNMIDTAYQIPFLYLSADWPAEHEDINAHIYINKSTDYFYEAKLLKSGHPNFMDIPFMIPVQSVAGTGEIDPYLGMEIITKLVTLFFDKHIQSKSGADLQKINEQYELLDMIVHEGDSIL